MTVPPSFNRRPTRYADKPRRVRNGLRLNVTKWPDRLGPMARRFLDSCLPGATPDIWAAALGYAKAGQTREIEFDAGEVRANVQETTAAPTEVALRFREYSVDQWNTAIDLMNQRAVFAATLLAGELPPGIDELFDGMGLRLEPRYPDDIEAIQHGRELDHWTPAACCVAMLIADTIDKDPFTLFRLRGLAGEDLIDRLRQKREADLDAVPLPGSDSGRLASEPTAPPLDANLARFWEAGPELDLVETTPRPAEVSTPLLRRLGPSPFKTARFPLVGLLATVYEVVSKGALEGPGNGECTRATDDEPTS
jgi:uncharacterized Zn finger protein